MPRIVITGPPGSGKSTLIEKLKQIGNYVVPEVGRSVKEFLTAYEPEKAQNNEYLQQFIQSKQLENYVTRTNAFFDRGMPDDIAYNNFFGIDSSFNLLSRCRYYRYDVVLYLPYWDYIYRQDTIRVETKKEAKRIGELIKDIYTNLGYEIINIPKGDVETRANYVESICEEYLRKRN